MSSSRPRLFVELCAGMAAVSLRLVGGPHANPPIGMMGGKRGYARAILGVLGLRQGQGADEVWLADPGPCGGVWEVLTSPGGADAVAAVIRAWEGEEPRALWERLRAQGWGELTTPEEVGAYTWMGAFSYRQGHPESGWRGDESGYPIEADGIASRVSAVARWLVAAGWAYRKGEPDSGVNPSAVYGSVRTETNHGGNPLTVDYLASCCRSWPVPVRVFPDARAVPIPEECTGVFCYLDPPYHGDGSAKITGYVHDLPRADVLDLARRWDAAGAVVAISEAVPLDLPGWHHVRIDGERIGQKRTFSRQKDEYLTLNREPAWRPVVGQVALFAPATVGDSP